MRLVPVVAVRPCDGTRQVGLFWSEALGWPLVWDQNQETAIQSPHGDTKIARGVPPVAPNQVRNRQRLDLARPTATRQRRSTGGSPSAPPGSRSMTKAPMTRAPVTLAVHGDHPARADQ